MSRKRKAWWLENRDHAEVFAEELVHLYYTFDDDVVIIRALWGARRERGPQFEP